MLQRAFIRPSGLDGDNVVAQSLFLQDDRPQRNVVRHGALATIKPDEVDAYCAAIQFADSLAKLFPALLRNFGRCHNYFVRPRDEALRFTLLLFKCNVLGERRRILPPTLRCNSVADDFHRLVVTSERFIALGVNFFCV